MARANIIRFLEILPATLLFSVEVSAVEDQIGSEWPEGIQS